jgi:phage terminase large subunit-like protein
MAALDNLNWLDSLPDEAKKALLIEAQAELNREKIADYRPYQKQKDFHALGKIKRERLLRAGNQNGKSFCVGSEAAYHLTGEYPDWWQGRRWDRPTVVWASGETGEATRDNPQRVLIGLPKEEGTGAIPARCLGEYGKASGVADLYDYFKVRHVSGGWSMLRFKYYAQGAAKWQGPPVDFVWFDEEPPEDIYDEGLARTIATGGMAAMSFTPLKGMSAVVMRFLGDNATEDRADVNMTIEDAEHISPAERARIIASFPAHQREARAKGIPTLGSGAIFPVAEESITVEPFSIPKHWPRICGLDFGWDHPTAAAWIAWDRDTDTLYVYDAYRVAEQPIPIHAAAIRAKGKWIPVAWPHDGWQTEKGSGVQLAEQYKACDVEMLDEHAQFEETGQDSETQQSLISVEAGLQEMLTRMETGRWKVFSHLKDWFAEFRLYHRDNGKIVKLFDDLLSASRYAMMMLRHAIVEPTRQTSAPRPPPEWRAC